MKKISFVFRSINTYTRTDPSLGKASDSFVSKKPKKLSEAVAEYGFFPTNIINLLHSRYDISSKGTQRYLRKTLEKYERSKQCFVPARHAVVGPDLATAHFIIYRNGKIWFKDFQDWSDNISDIPQKFNPFYKVVKIDASNCNLYSEAIENFVSLNNLEELNLSNNPKLCDFGCDRLARQYRNSKTLKYINLSNCTDISDRGLSAFVKIPSLKHLVFKNTKAARFKYIELFEILFNEVNPNCKIEY